MKVHAFNQHQRGRGKRVSLIDLHIKVPVSQGQSEILAQKAGREARRRLEM